MLSDHLCHQKHIVFAPMEKIKMFMRLDAENVPPSSRLNVENNQEEITRRRNNHSIYFIWVNTEFIESQTHSVKEKTKHS